MELEGLQFNTLIIAWCDTTWSMLEGRKKAIFPCPDFFISRKPTLVNIITVKHLIYLAFWLVFIVNLIQTKITWKKTRVIELPASDWLESWLWEMMFDN